MEKTTISLTLEITKPRKVTWFKNGVQIDMSDRFQSTTDEFNLTHTLTVSDCTMDENAEFTVQIEDNQYGVMTCSCKVTVKGQL